MVLDMGADLCGIASVERFRDAPIGFHPRGIYDNTKSVLVFAKRIPTEALFASNCVAYTHANTLAAQVIDSLTYAISLQLEYYGIKNVLIPTDDPYEFWDSR